MTSSIPVILERDNVNDDSVKLVRWFVKHGEKVEADTLLAEVETSKANMEVHSPAAGFLVQDFLEGAEVPVSAAIAHIAAQAPNAQALVNSPAAPKSASEPVNGKIEPAISIFQPKPAALKSKPAEAHHPEFQPASDYPQRFSPVAAKMMEVHGLTATDFPGRSVVRKQDILDFLNPPQPHLEPARTAPATAAGKPVPSVITQPYKAIPLSKMKRREGAALAAGGANAVSSAVSVTCFTRGLRRIVETKMQDGNASAILAYEVSRLLRKYPTLNAAFHNGTMLQYEQVNLGFAIDDGRGLKVAVLRNSDTLSLSTITDEMRELTMAYLEDKLAPAQIANATFTISDMSGLGVSAFYPLISENQSGILGVGGEQFAPGGEYGFYTLTLTFDHQLSDGRTAAFFLNDLKHRMLSYENTASEGTQQLSCSDCGRTSAQLIELNEYLLRSAVPDGFVCSLCSAGY